MQTVIPSGPLRSEARIVGPADKLAPMSPPRNRAENVDDPLRRLEESIAELRAETGAEALELRARVRALEKRVEQLGETPPEPQPRPRRKKAERPKQRAARSGAPRRQRSEPER
jgi:hypothetical protein